MGAATPAHALEGPRRFGLFVGANDGGQYRVTLRYAHDDARQIAGVLADLGGIAPTDRRLLLDPSVARLSVALDDLAAQLATVESGPTEVVFYYSGHADERGLLLGAERFAYETLRERLEALPATVRIGILDACASGSMVRGKGGRPVSPFLVDTARRVEGTAFITSSSADEVSQEADRIGGSYFTHYLVSGLRGAADTTQDGQVTLHEAYNHAFTETLTRTSQSQHGPQHANYDFQLAGTGDLVLTDLNRTTAELVLDDDVEGNLLVRAASGRIVVEVNKRANTPLRLGLAPGRYTLTFSRDGQYAEVPVALEAHATARVAASDLGWSDGEVAVARGGGEIFVWNDVRVRVQVLPTADDRDVADQFTLGLVANRSGRLHGAAIALGANFVDQDATGAMVALGFNTTGGDLRGVQGALLFNHLGGDGGYQFATGANVAEGTIRGAQLAVGMNLGGGAVNGVQGAVGLNISTQRLVGLQLAAGGNIARRSLYGVQIAAGFNAGDGVRGVQIGLVNIGGDVRGAQFGLVNIGGTVRGMQIGLVNIADEVKGLPIGLVSVSKEGRVDPMVYGDESTPVNLDLKLGNRWFYTWFGGGGSPGRHGWGGGGVGTQLVHRPLLLDFDLGAQVILPWPATVGESPDTFVGRARLTLGVPLGEHFAIVAGLNVKLRWWANAEPVAVAPLWIDGENRLLFWPGFHAGLQF